MRGNTRRKDKGDIHTRFTDTRIEKKKKKKKTRAIIKGQGDEKKKERKKVCKMSL